MSQLLPPSGGADYGDVLIGGRERDLKVFADTDVCQSYANCVIESPEVFVLDESSGKVHLISATPRPEFEGAVRRAVAECPVRALSVQE